MRAYRCTNGFHLPVVDDDGFMTDDCMEVEVGTVWRLGDRAYVTGAQVRLDSDGGWIEISEESLAEYFEVVSE
jgi:hypothetical protein